MLMIRRTKALSLFLRNFIWVSLLSLSTPSGGEAQGNDRFSLQGVSHLNDTWRFSLKDLNQNTSFWIALNQTLGDVKATAYNAEDGILKLVIGGAETSLSLSKASGEPLQVTKSISMPGYAEHTVPAHRPRGTPPPPPNEGAPPETSPPDEIPETPDFASLRKARSAQ